MSIKYINVLKCLVPMSIGFFNYIYAGVADIIFHNISKHHTYVVEPFSHHDCMDDTVHTIEVKPSTNVELDFHFSSTGVKCAGYSSYQDIFIYAEDAPLFNATFQWYKGVGCDPVVKDINDPNHLIVDPKTSNYYLDMDLNEFIP
ncbi:MAG: hypothetical protein K2P99_01055 [Burkholderiales bacterium]|nr:hypothetical protein [Burkholderiales bacterium]